jgi:sulfite exporter TauE/SafE
MNTSAQLTALLLGLTGSLHCVGMCSPLVMAVTQVKPGAVFNKFLYNGGRVLTYATLGAFISAFGMAIRFSEFQIVISLVVGCLLVIAGIAGISDIRIPILTTVLQKVSSVLKTSFGKFIQRKTKLSMIVLGMLNGLLPCGLTYLALTYCLTLAGPLDGFNFMLLFGAGTLPVMLGFTSVLQFFIKRFHFNINRLTKVMLVTVGCLLIGRVFFSHFHNHNPASIKQHVVDVICK